MGKIDIDKFIASVMECLCKPHREGAYLCIHWITKALDAQGLMFKDGKIVELEVRGDEDSKLKKELIEFINRFKASSLNKATVDKYESWISWLEKQSKKKSIDDLTAQEAMDIAVEKCFEGDKRDTCEKPYSFKSIPRLLEMIEPSDKAKAYCKKLINSLNEEGYTADAKVVGECLKMMNGQLPLPKGSGLPKAPLGFE